MGGVNYFMFQLTSQLTGKTSTLTTSCLFSSGRSQQSEPRPSPAEELQDRTIQRREGGVEMQNNPDLCD